MIIVLRKDGRDAKSKGVDVCSFCLREQTDVSLLFLRLQRGSPESEALTHRFRMLRTGLTMVDIAARHQAKIGNLWLPKQVHKYNTDRIRIGSPHLALRIYDLIVIFH